MCSHDENTYLGVSLPTEIWTAVFSLLDEAEKISFRQVNFNFLDIYERFKAKKHRFVCSESLTAMKHMWRVSEYISSIEYVSMRPEFISFPESLKDVKFTRCPSIDISRLPKTIESFEAHFGNDPQVNSLFPHLTIIEFPSLRSFTVSGTGCSSESQGESVHEPGL